ncbi:MAG: NAD(P)H-hydrate dehydratase [Desulfovibrionaceae bacterium]
MWLIVGTVPHEDFPLTFGVSRMEGDHLYVGEQRVSVDRGTAALAAAAWLTCATYHETGAAPQECCVPHLLLVGDTGDGKGSRAVYAWLVENLVTLAAQPSALCGLTFHYLFPDVDWHNRVLMSIEMLARKPLLVADAGFMYVAKMSGYADAYDLFTPDVGEMAFLADENAPHPFYTRGFLLATENDIPTLLTRAHSHGNCAQNLIVKGAKDYVVQGANILDTVDSPAVEAMEAIGGTGDIVTGIVTGLLALGLPMREACLKAVRTSRLLAHMAAPDPATQVGELLRMAYFERL